MYIYWGRCLTFIPTPKAPQGRGHGHGGSVEERSRKLGPSTPDLHPGEREHKYRGLGVQRYSEATFEHTFDGCRDGGDVGDLTQSRRSRSESRCSAYTVVRTDHYQSRREAGLTGILGAPHLRSKSQRGQPKHSVPSKLSWHSSRASMPNTRFISTPRPSPPSDNYVSRTPLPLRARSKYFTHASPR